MELSFVCPCQFSERHTSLTGPNNNLIVNISDVLYEHYIVPQTISHYSPQNVKANISPRVSHMRFSINRRSALRYWGTGGKSTYE
jgi:hypothetical protein